MTNTNTIPGRVTDSSTTIADKQDSDTLKVERKHSRKESLRRRMLYNLAHGNDDARKMASFVLGILDSGKELPPFVQL